MTRPWLGNGNFLIAVFKSCRHFLRPVFPVTVLNAKGDGGSKGFAPTNSGANLDLVLLNQHPAAPTITLLAAPKIVVDSTYVDRKSRGHPVNDHSQTRSVGFTRSKVTQHAGYPTLFCFGRLGGWHADICLTALCLSHLLAPELFGGGEVL